MRTPPRKVPTFILSCLSWLDVWLKEVEVDCCKHMSTTAFVDWVIGKVETPGAGAPPSVPCLVQPVVFGSEPDLYQTSAVRGGLSTKSKVRTCRVVVAAMTGPDAPRRQSALQRMLKYLLEAPSTCMLCLLGSFSSLFSTDTGSVRFRDRVVVESFRISLTARPEQVIYTSPNIVACYVTNLQSRKRFLVKGGGIMAPPVFNSSRLNNRNAHRIGWRAQRTLTARDQLAISEGSAIWRSWYSCFLLCGDRWLAPNFLAIRKRRRSQVAMKTRSTFLRQARHGIRRRRSASSKVSYPTALLRYKLYPLSYWRKFANVLLSSELFTMAAKISANGARGSIDGHLTSPLALNCTESRIEVRLSTVLE